MLKSKPASEIRLLVKHDTFWHHIYIIKVLKIFHRNITIFVIRKILFSNQILISARLGLYFCSSTHIKPCKCSYNKKYWWDFLRGSQISMWKNVNVRVTLDISLSIAKHWFNHNCWFCLKHRGQLQNCLYLYLFKVSFILSKVKDQSYNGEHYQLSWTTRINLFTNTQYSYVSLQSDNCNNY